MQRNTAFQQLSAIFALASLGLVFSVEPTVAGKGTLTSSGTSIFSVSRAPMLTTPPRIRQRAELTDTVQMIGDWTGLTVAISGDTVVAGAPI